ncbi:MAG: polyphosphate kinase 2 [Clostridiaceae bacterium]|jgi:polyphosphate kinase 2|nr:polyphosphate kinase 2 [Clostridiaceae bacterium]
MRRKQDPSSPKTPTENSLIKDSGSPDTNKKKKMTSSDKRKNIQIGDIEYESFTFHGRPMYRITDKSYYKELERLQVELVKLQEWVKAKGLRVVVLFEGRDAAGKGSVIKRITEAMNPRICRVEALPAPTPKEESQWFFQRYVAKLPSAGEIVLFDRSWYNRAGVERVMGFCTEGEYREFFRSCPEFENMLIRSGIILIKYWFSVSDEEQEKRFEDRIEDPAKRWKLSKMDLESRRRWSDYSRAKDEMFEHTDTKESPWYVVNADIKKHARLNCIAHLLSMLPYEDLTPEPLELPPRQEDSGYVRPPINKQNFIPERYGSAIASKEI